MEDEAGVFKIVLRFGFAYLVISLFVWLSMEIWSAITNRDIIIGFALAITLAAITGAATVAATKFIQDNKRVPTNRERNGVSP
jgi:hypothetical protein